MTLPAALLKRLASRGIVSQKSKTKGSSENELEGKERSKTEGREKSRFRVHLPPFSVGALANLSGGSSQGNQSTAPGNEEVIAEDYDEMEYPSQYENYEPAKRPEENFWIERMKMRIGDNNYVGFKGCPNKYNIYHKCTLYCVNRWENCPTDPSPEYMVRYRRLIKKYPLPKGWMEVYDMGCASYYFWNSADNMVSWLPPTHPKSQITKCAALLRRQLEEALPMNSDDDDKCHEDADSDHSTGHDGGLYRTLSQKPAHELSEKELEEMIHSAMRKSIPSPDSVSSETPPPILDEVPVRKHKSRDLEKTVLRNRQHNKRNRRQITEADPLDPMDPSAYSDIPRGKWSDGLNNERDRDGSKTQTEPAAKKLLQRETRLASKSDEDD